MYYEEKTVDAFGRESTRVICTARVVTLANGKKVIVEDSSASYPDGAKLSVEDDYYLSVAE